MEAPFQIEEATIDMMQKAMEHGELSSEALTILYLERIAAYDKNGIRINSVMELNPDALYIARSLDAERAANGSRGPLHGIPIFIKDNIDTGDSMHTSAGSLALADHYARADSFVAKKLREAGAVILGKTNMTEWANFMAYHMANGYSSRGGQVLNPYGPGTFDVGGSSAGTGAAIAANLAAAGVGTETSGSILNPSCKNSLVGIKPTVGLISRSGMIPIAHSQDTAGPMARTVKDAALLLGALAGEDEKDPATTFGKDRMLTDYTAFLQADGLKSARIGIEKNHLSKLNDEELSIVERALKKLEKQGAALVYFDTISKLEWDSSVLFHEFKIGINAYLSKAAPHLPVHSLRDVIVWNEEHRVSALKYGQRVLLDAQEKSGTLTDSEYIHDRLNDLKRAQAEGINAAMDEHKLDAILFADDYGSDIAAKAGYPSITVPAGYTFLGKPFGITFTARAFEEPALLKIAYNFEQATKHRKAPKLSDQ